jgi:hypothetical protein
MRAFRGTYGLKIIGHGNPDSNLESLCIASLMLHSLALLIYRKDREKAVIVSLCVQHEGDWIALVDAEYESLRNFQRLTRKETYVTLYSLDSSAIAVMMLHESMFIYYR